MTAVLFLAALAGAFLLGRQSAQAQEPEVVIYKAEPKPQREPQPRVSMPRGKAGRA